MFTIRLLLEIVSKLPKYVKSTWISQYQQTKQRLILSITISSTFRLSYLLGSLFTEYLPLQFIRQSFIHLPIRRRWCLCCFASSAGARRVFVVMLVLLGVLMALVEVNVSLASALNRPTIISIIFWGC